MKPERFSKKPDTRYRIMTQIIVPTPFDECKKEDLPTGARLVGVTDSGSHGLYYTPSETDLSEPYQTHEQREANHEAKRAERCCHPNRTEQKFDFNQQTLF